MFCGPGERFWRSVEQDVVVNYWEKTARCFPWVSDQSVKGSRD